MPLTARPHVRTRDNLRSHCDAEWREMSRSTIKTITRRARAVTAPPPALEDRYINRAQLRALIPAFDMTLWRWQRNPKVAFPAPIKLGDDGRNYWWLPQVRAWMQQRAALTQL